MNGYVRAFGKKMAPINPTATIAIAPSGPNITSRMMPSTAAVRSFTATFMSGAHATPDHGAGANCGEHV